MLTRRSSYTLYATNDPTEQVAQIVKEKLVNSSLERYDISAGPVGFIE
jgi:hypothetical protein